MLTNIKKINARRNISMWKGNSLIIFIKKNKKIQSIKPGRNSERKRIRSAKGVSEVRQAETYFLS